MADEHPAVPSAKRVQRVKTDTLLDSEKAELAERGVDTSGEFVDVDLSAPPPKVDPKQAERTNVASKLAAPGMGSKLPDVNPPAPDNRDDRIAELEAQLEETKQELADKPDTCPRCHWAVDKKVLEEPTDEDKKEFLKCVCSGESFKKAYSVFGGAAQVEFCTRPNPYVIAVTKAIKMLVRVGEVSNTEEMFFLTNELNFLTAISSISVDGNSAPLVDVAPDDDDFYEKTRNKLANVQEPMVFAMRDAYAKFTHIVDHLVANSSDPNYWGETES